MELHPIFFSHMDKYIAQCKQTYDKKQKNEDAYVLNARINLI